MACVRARFKVPWASCFRRRHQPFVRFPEVACDNLPFGILKRVLRAARTGKSYFRNCFLPCMVFNATAHRCAVESLLQTGWGPACLPTGRALSRSTPQILPAVWISKDRPSIAPESPSPLPVSALLQRPLPVGCYTFWMFRPRGFTPPRRISPRRSCPHCCSGSRSWGSSSFHE